MRELVDRLTMEIHLNSSGTLHSMAADVRHGLTAIPKYLPPKYFYDEKGSELFERITELPEYYPTRTERGMLEQIADTLLAELQPAELVELGSGSSSKTRAFLAAKHASTCLRRYIPFDVSESIVRDTAQSLLAECAFLSVHGVIGDFEADLPRIPAPHGSRLLLFLGSTIGNMDAAQRNVFLTQVRRLLGKDGAFLLGVDLVKEVSMLEAAYDDAQGVTAEFNRNILRVVNKGLHANFHPEAFRHVAFYNQDMSRIEMHLEAEKPQTVRIADLDMTVQIARGERIWTESSYKFTEQSTRQMLRDAGLQLTRWHTDPDKLFGLALAKPA